MRNSNRRVCRDNLPPGRMELLDKLRVLQLGVNSRLRGRKHPYAVSVSRESRVNNMTNDNGDVSGFIRLKHVDKYFYNIKRDDYLLYNN